MQTIDGITTHPSTSTVQETLDRLESLLHQKGIKIFARIDQSAEAAAVGLSLPPTQLLIFGNPKAGTPIMAAAPLAGLDLPLKALAWQDTSGQVWLSYNTPASLGQRFSVDDHLIAPLTSLDSLIRQAIA